jgi:hypothetical protein
VWSTSPLFERHCGHSFISLLYAHFGRAHEESLFSRIF